MIKQPSKKRGRPGNHKLKEGLKEVVRDLIEDNYKDFGPTLAHEKLIELHKLEISLSSVRSIMIKNELWQSGRKKRKKIFQYRERRKRKGELIQMDGSPHAWFEDRGPECSLIYTVDDATGEILAARFVPSESTWSYFGLMEQHIKEHGRPLSLYTDKHVVFRVNHKDAISGKGITQFGRAMKELDIELIYTGDS